MAEESQDDGSRREVEALLAWRDQAVREGRIKLGLLKDSDLRNVVSYGRKDVRVIRGMLSRDARGFAEKMVEILAEVGRSSSSSPSTSPSSAAPPPAPSSSIVTPAGGPHSGTARERRPPEEPARRPAPVQPAPGDEDRAERVKRFVPTRRIAQLPEPVPLRLIELAQGLRLRWGAYPSAETVTVYRVVSHDRYWPPSPESSELVELTDQLTAVDQRLPEAALRYYRVYGYTGPSEEELYEAQPTLIASAVQVFGVQGVTLEEDEGRVTGRWRALPGVERVQVFRIPVEENHLAERADERYRLNREDNLGGFVDKETVRGRRYRYEFYVECRVDDRPRLSDPISVEHTVSASLTRVTDLQVNRRFDQAGSVSFDLSWTRPAAGEVRIFRTESGPMAGATNEVHLVEALPQTRLDPASLLNLLVVDLGDGREGALDVPAREGWSRIQLTPVTILDGKARVGDTVTQLVVGEPTQPEVVERCDYQVVKFGWPRGAAKVVAVVRGTTDSVDAPQAGERGEEIDEVTYRRLGGLQLTQLLPGEGCAVHLTGQAFNAGRAHYGRRVSIPYPGLLRLSYTLETRQRMFRLDRVVVRLSAERDVDPAPVFVLVHRPDRLPLHAHDGSVLEVTLDLDTATAPSRLLQPGRLGPTPTPVGWTASVRGLSGYLRLFVDTSQGRLALLDPPSAALVLG